MGNRSTQRRGSALFMVAKDSRSIIATDLELASTSGVITKQSVETKENSTETTHYAWGGSDKFPIDLIGDAKKDTVILPGLRFKTEMQYGAGLSHGTISIDKTTGKETFVPQRVPEVISFLRNSNSAYTFYTIFYDLNFFGVAFPMFHLSKDGKSIVRMSTRGSRAKACRLGKADKYGNFNIVRVNADFGTSDRDPNADISYDCAPQQGLHEWLEERKAKKNTKPFIFPVFLPDYGSTYYPTPDWNSARESKWLELSSQIAIFKSFMMKNQVSLQYHIEIHNEYWPTRFGREQWGKMSEEEKLNAAQDEFNEINDRLTKPENSGKSIMTSLGYSKNQPDKTYSLIKVTEIGHKFSKDGTYIEDSKEASEHKISALGLHPEIIGAAPGQKMGAGSGSGNRTAFNQRVYMSKGIQDFVAYPMYQVAQYNGWSPDLEFVFRNSLIETKDRGEITQPEP